MNIAVIFAGGYGSRVNKEGMPKQFLKILGVPVIIHTLRKFEQDENVDAIVVVILKKYLNYMNELLQKYEIKKVKEVVIGGKSGQESIYHGLLAAKKICAADDTIVLIHDGVRPIFENDLIKRNIEAVKKFGSAVSCVDEVETILCKEKDQFNVLKRDNLFIARAPQSFYLKDILKAHEIFKKTEYEGIVDSCSLMRASGYHVHLVKTIPENLKITYPGDFVIVKSLMQNKEGMVDAENL